jgi:hypothetical protein
MYGFRVRETLWRGTQFLVMERHFIRETGANNPAIGYNLTPRWSESEV